MNESSIAERARRFTMTVVARNLLSDVVAALSAHGVDVMPLKGVLLQVLVYDDPTDRMLVDVDVAVRSAEFARANAALLEAGFRVVLEEPGLYQVVFSNEPSPLCVDLHRRFAAARRFRLTPDAMFARGRRDEKLFGFPVVLPDDYDLYAHLLAHSMLDYAIGGAWHRPEDLGRVVRVRCLDPACCARRLDEHGLGRFARVALARGTPGGDDPFGAQVLANLRRDWVGDALARGARAVYGRDGSPALLRRVAALMLNPSLAEAGLALVEAAMARAGFRPG